MPIAPSLAFASVAIAGQLVGSFAWLAVSAEDAPDLIAVAPVDKGEVDRAKLGAALAMAAPLALLLPIAIALRTPLGAIVTLAMTAGGGALAGWIELKLGKPADRAAPSIAAVPARSSPASLTLLVTIVLGGIAAVAVYFIG